MSVNNDVTHHYETGINHVHILPHNIITPCYYVCCKGGANKLFQSLSKFPKRYILLHPTVYYCILLHPTVYYCTLLHPTVYYCTLLHPTVYYCTLLHPTVYYCTLLHPTVYYCTLLHPTASYYNQEDKSMNLQRP
jgi:hypothetical protein